MGIDPIYLANNGKDPTQRGGRLALAYLHHVVMTCGDDWESR